MEQFDTFQKAKLPSNICFLEVLLFTLGYFYQKMDKGLMKSGRKEW